MSSDNGEKSTFKDRGRQDETNTVLDTVLRLVICQGNLWPPKSEFTVAEAFLWMYAKCIQLKM